jgi:hypothetical protein
MAVDISKTKLQMGERASSLRVTDIGDDILMYLFTCGKNLCNDVIFAFAGSLFNIGKIARFLILSYGESVYTIVIHPL